jgi:hypothetical protein
LPPPGDLIRRHPILELRPLESCVDKICDIPRTCPGLDELAKPLIGRLDDSFPHEPKFAIKFALGSPRWDKSAHAASTFFPGQTLNVFGVKDDH